MLQRLPVPWKLIRFSSQFSQQLGGYSAHEEQFGVLRFEGQEDYADPLDSVPWTWAKRCAQQP
jgi:hypothetical protein